MKENCKKVLQSYIVDGKIQTKKGDLRQNLTASEKCLLKNEYLETFKSDDGNVIYLFSLTSKGLLALATECEMDLGKYIFTLESEEINEYFCKMLVSEKTANKLSKLKIGSDEMISILKSEHPDRLYAFHLLEKGEDAGKWNVYCIYYA